jgi:hypothetical protein
MYLHSKTAALTRLPAALPDEVRPVSPRRRQKRPGGDWWIVPRCQSLEVEEK